MRRGINASFWLLYLGAVLSLLGGFAGELHPAGTALAVFRLYALLAVAVAMLVFAMTKRRIMAALSLVLLGYGAYSVAPQLRNPQPVEGLLLLQSNTRFDNDARGLVDYAKAHAPDIITLQEVTTRSIPQLAQLRGLYPYQVICPYGSVGGVAILSKFRFSSPQGQGCHAGQGMVSAQVEAPWGEITVVSLHMHWPWPYGQTAQLAELLPLLAALNGPVIVGGDFNMVPWALPVAQVATATDTTVIGGLRFSKSLFSGIVQLPIDHILVPNGWQASAETGPKLGSDHNAILARFAPEGRAE